MHGPADRRIVVKSRYKQRRSFIAIAMDTSVLTMASAR
jgi:hypothetical protein